MTCATRSTTGAKANAAMRLQHRYLDRVMAAATTDERAMAALTDVLFLLARPESMFKPAMVRRALRHPNRAAKPQESGADAAQIGKSVRAWDSHGRRHDDLPTFLVDPRRR